MGNITALTLQGWLYNTTWGLIDDLTMAYDGNRLVKCDDDVSAQPTYNAAHHFQDLADSAVEYEYDGNGNMTKDLKIPIKREQSKLVCSAEREEFGMKFNRNISKIEYNCLNLPEKTIILGDGMRTYIDNTYDAAGTKLRTTVGQQMTAILRSTGSDAVGDVEDASENATSTIRSGAFIPQVEDYGFTVDYCGNAIYRNDTLQMLLLESGNGYVTFDERGDATYHYYLKDHLGSVREVVNAGSGVVQVNDYYPSGTLIHTSSGGTLQPYKYIGKELDRTAGIDHYDFGARIMDPTVGGRFTSMDPMAGKYYYISPYVYCGGDPVGNIDDDGRDYWSTNDKDKIIEFWNALGKGDSYFDFSGWEHATDAEIAANLVYNDETQTYYTSYTEIVDNELYVVGKTFKANLKPVTSDGKGCLGAFVYEPADGFLSFIGFLNGGFNYNDGSSNWHVNLDGRIVGYTPISGEVNVNASKGKAIAKLLEKGARLIKNLGFSHKQRIYKLGNKYYSWDIDKHHGGVFKVFELRGGKLHRIGTVDENLNIIAK
jgi:RHS repeat-associated protein